MTEQPKNPSPPPEPSREPESDEQHTVRNVPVQPSNLSPVAAPKTGQKCPTCGFYNRMGVLVCENCGTNLLSGDSTIPGTRQFAGQEQKKEPDTVTLSVEEIQAIKTAGTDVFDETMVLRLEIEAAPAPILIYPKAETSLGRRDPATGTMPDVDLTTYAGYRMGVSRRHAVIRLNNKRLEIYDLGSSNGTSVNGVRLAPHQPYPLRDGDEISLGKMAMRAIFQVGGRKLRSF